MTNFFCYAIIYKMSKFLVCHFGTELSKKEILIFSSFILKAKRVLLFNKVYFLYCSIYIRFKVNIVYSTKTNKTNTARERKCKK